MKYEGPIELRLFIKVMGFPVVRIFPAAQAFVLLEKFHLELRQILQEVTDYRDGTHNFKF